MRNHIHNFARHPYRPIVRYDVFPNTDAAQYVLSERPRQLKLPTLNFHLVGKVSVPEEKRSRQRIIYANFHYAALEESA